MRTLVHVRGEGGKQDLLDEVSGCLDDISFLHHIGTGDVIAVKVYFTDERGLTHSQGTEKGLPNLQYISVVILIQALLC